MPRQLVIARRGGQQAVVLIEVFNESGQAVAHVEWSDGPDRVKPVALDAKLPGRYMVRITSGGRSEVLRFRKD